jgi:phage anti-repressor protein
MSNSNIVHQDIASLLDGWIESEQNGTEFPVPFDLAWGIAGYTRKDNAKRRLLNKKSRLIENTDYLLTSEESSQGGRSSDLIQLTCDAFKAFCLLAETDEGDLIRGYFIESEKKWKLVQKIVPEVAQEVEVLHLKIELAKIEAQKAALEDKTLSLRHYVVSVLPKATADRVLGVTEIAGETKVQTVVVNKYGQILDAGNTVTKSKLAERYGFVSKMGKPDTRLVAELIDEAILRGAIADPWKDSRVVAAPGFDASLVPALDRFYQSSPVQCQRWTGEN